MSTKIRNRIIRLVLLLTLITPLAMGVITSCKKDKKDNTGLLVLLGMLSLNQSNTPKLLAIPSGVAK